MDWYLELNDMPFDAIKTGKKTRETRTKVPHNMTPYEEIKPGDRIIFTRKTDKEKMICEVLGVRHYLDIASMFDVEGQENCMSYDTSRDEAIASYDQLRGYVEGIKQHGIWAIEVKPLKTFFLTQFPEINVLLEDLLSRIKEILGGYFVGMYVGGSLANGGFDPESSDIDFYVVINKDITAEKEKLLADMHKNVFDENKRYKFEASYIPQQDLVNFDPLKQRLYSNRGELSMQPYESSFVVEIFILQKNGITVEGPTINDISKLVTTDELKRGSFDNLEEYWVGMIDSPKLEQDIYQEFAVMTMCRTLYTIEHRTVAPKPVAAKWVKEKFGEEWADLIDFALKWKPGVQFDRLQEVRNFIKFSIDQAKTYF